MRSPERVLVHVPVASRPRFEVGLGTLEEGPLTFRLAARPSRETAAKDEVVLLERTLTTTAPLGAGHRRPLAVRGPRDRPLPLPGLGHPRTRRPLGLAGGAEPGRHAPRREPEGGLPTAAAGRDRRLGRHPAARPPRRLRVLEAHEPGHRSSGRRGHPLQGCRGSSHLDQGLHALRCSPRSTPPPTGSPTSAIACPARPSPWPRSSGKRATPRPASPPSSSSAASPTSTRASRSFTSRAPCPTTRAARPLASTWIGSCPGSRLTARSPSSSSSTSPTPTIPTSPGRPTTPCSAIPGGRRSTSGRRRQVETFITDPMSRTFMIPTRDELVSAKIDPEAFVGYNRDLYDGSIRGMDAEIGRLVERLEDLGLQDKTLLVFTGDHGEEFLEHGRTFHGQTTYGELGNVPLILWGAGVPKGAVVEDTVQDVDLYPTLLEMSRLAVPQGRAGPQPPSPAGRGRPGAMARRARDHGEGRDPRAGGGASSPRHGERRHRLRRLQAHPQRQAATAEPRVRALRPPQGSPRPDRPGAAAPGDRGAPVEAARWPGNGWRRRDDSSPTRRPRRA